MPVSRSVGGVHALGSTRIAAARFTAREQVAITPGRVNESRLGGIGLELAPQADEVDGLLRAIVLSLRPKFSHHVGFRTTGRGRFQLKVFS